MDQQQRTNRRTSPWIVVGVLVAIVAVLAVVAIAVGGSDDSDDSQVAAANPGSATDGGADADAPDATGDAPAATVEYGPVSLAGAALPPVPERGPDPAIGSVAPTAQGVDFTETPSGIGPGGGIRLVAFLAHWCPHCNEEAPRLAAAVSEGLPAGVSVVIVPTGSRSDAPNWPPSRWVAATGLGGLPTVLDDEAQSLAAAYGLRSYPYLVLLDDDNTVLARFVGTQAHDFFPQLFGRLATAG